jgi:bifunctional non-homologous end joining protein LigD
VIQEHSATRLHWDLRLEREGTLMSWALPRGLPHDPGQNRLAVRTEDHPLEYLDFAGTIPKGNYGAGEMRIVDRGTFEMVKHEPEKMTVELHGERLGGRYALFRTDGKNWLVHRMDPPAPGREPVPERIEPMRASEGKRLPPDDEEWGYEIRWHGVRAQAYLDAGKLRLLDDAGEVTPAFPELRRLHRQVGIRDAVLDGCLAALDAEGRPDRERSEHRRRATSSGQGERVASQVPVTYVIFDLLYLDGESLLRLPFTERAERLAALELEGDGWRTPAYHRGEGELFAEALRQQGVGGLVAKKLDSTYRPGSRGRDWREIAVS